jgi:hypothetical protein
MKADLSFPTQEKNVHSWGKVYKHSAQRVTTTTNFTEANQVHNKELCDANMYYKQHLLCALSLEI